MKNWLFAESSLAAWAIETVPRELIAEAMRCHAVARALDADVREWDGAEWREVLDRSSDIHQWLMSAGRSDVADAITVEHNLSRQLMFRDVDPMPRERERLREVRAALSGRKLNKRHIRLSWWLTATREGKQ